MKYEEILERLKAESRPEAIEGMVRFGITPGKAFGVSVPVMRALAREIGKDHELAQRLWKAGYRETQIIASMVDEPEKVTEAQADAWTKQFDYWEICDQACMNLFEKLPFAYEKAVKWSKSQEEFVKRAGYVLMARLAVSDKSAEDGRFETFFPLLKTGSTDDRNMVKKAVNWALRQIGKRNKGLNKKAIAVANEIKKQESKSARWIASDALRELKSEAVQRRLKA